jgi:hypothetical protein
MVGLSPMPTVAFLAGEPWGIPLPPLSDSLCFFSVGTGVPALLSRKDAARYLSVSSRMLDSLRIPRVEITDRCLRYRREDLDRFAQERIRA